MIPINGRSAAIGLAVLIPVLTGGGSGGCGSSPSEATNGFSESDIGEASKDAALPHNVVVAQLEHPQAGFGADPDGVPGEDRIPYRFDETREMTFCMEDDDGQAHRMILKDASGAEVLSVTAGGPCVQQILPAGDYTQTLVHDGTGEAEDVNAVFIQPQFEPVDEEFLEALSSPDGFKSQTIVSGCRYLDTWSLQIVRDGTYLSLNTPLKLFSNVTPDYKEIRAVGNWEIFKVYHCGGTRIALMAADGNFLTVPNGSCGWVASEGRGASIGARETFALGHKGGGVVNLYGTYATNGPPLFFDAAATPFILGDYGSCYDYDVVLDGDLRPTRQKAILVTTGSCQGCNLQGVNLADFNLSRTNLSGAFLQGATLSNAFLPDANFSGANLSNAHLDKVDFYKVGGNPTMQGATLFQTQFSDANLIDINLSGAKIEGANFTSAQMLGANLQGITHVRGTSNGHVSFVNTLLAGANFNNSTFDAGDFTNAIFSTKSGTVKLLVRNKPGTTVTQPYGFSATVRPLSTSSTTICPDGTNGPCTTDDQWKAQKPPVYEGYNDPNDW